MEVAEKVAEKVLETYRRLPSKGKPHVRSNGKKEWTVLAGIVVEADGKFQCVSAATGVKALADGQLHRANGKVLHDMHAEILAIRGLNLYLVDHCARILTEHANTAGTATGTTATTTAGTTTGTTTGTTAGTTAGTGTNARTLLSGSIVEYGVDGRPQVKPTVRIHLYVSEPPCGDGSLAELAKGAEAWIGGIETIGDGVLRGRANFHQSGIVRTKPGRRDSPLTLSKSCSDKLAISQMASVLRGPAAKVLSTKGAYLSTLVLPQGYSVEDTTRAFKSRLTGHGEPKDPGAPHPDNHAGSHDWAIAGNPTFKHELHFFEVVPTSLPFEHRRTPDAVPCPHGIVYVNGRAPEAILGGVKMGAKPFSGRGISMISRYALATAAREVEARSAKRSASTDSNEGGAETYLHWKHDPDRAQLKAAGYELIGGWVATSPDDFTLD